MITTRLAEYFHGDADRFANGRNPAPAQSRWSPSHCMSQSYCISLTHTHSHNTVHNLLSIAAFVYLYLTWQSSLVRWHRGFYHSLSRMYFCRAPLHFFCSAFCLFAWLDFSAGALVSVSSYMCSIHGLTSLDWLCIDLCVGCVSVCFLSAVAPTQCRKYGVTVSGGQPDIPFPLNAQTDADSLSLTTLASQTWTFAFRHTFISKLVSCGHLLEFQLLIPISFENIAVLRESTLSIASIESVLLVCDS